MFSIYRKQKTILTISVHASMEYADLGSRRIPSNIYLTISHWFQATARRLAAGQKMVDGETAAAPKDDDDKSWEEGRTSVTQLKRRAEDRCGGLTPPEVDRSVTAKIFSVFPFPF